MPTIFVVLATYHGGDYLRPLLQSIRCQSFSDWTLLVRDDGSTDQTVAQLKAAADVDSRIALLPSDTRLGAAGSFALLMQRAYESGADYLLFADQDDIWRLDKIQHMLETIQHAETRLGRDIPHLAYSDLTVVDAAGQQVHPSFLQCSRLRHAEGQPLDILLGRCFALGCASIVNRALLKFALPMPADTTSHDWWCALCAAAAGHVSYFPYTTLLYRRHGQNASGPAGFWAGFNPLRHAWSKRWQVGWQSFLRSIEQARALRSRLPAAPADSHRPALAMLDRFCAVFERSGYGWQRILKLHRMGLPAIDRPRRLIYDACVLHLPRTAWSESCKTLLKQQM